MPDNTPIGVFDFGFGGLTVFKKIREKLARDIAGGIGAFAYKYQRSLSGSGQ